MTVTQPRTCPIDGCTEDIRPGFLMCGTHWSRLPRKRRREVHRTWSLYLEAADAVAKAIAKRDYLLARAAAIYAVNVPVIAPQPDLPPDEETA